MKAFKTAAMLLSLGAALGGCSLKGGFLRDSVTMVEISDRPFTIVKTGISASSNVNMLFCSIELGNTNQYQEMMADLHEQAKLGPNQALVNIREDHKFTTYVGVFCKDAITLSADVIQFQ